MSTPSRSSYVVPSVVALVVALGFAVPIAAEALSPDPPPAQRDTCVPVPGVPCLPDPTLPSEVATVLPSQVPTTLPTVPTEIPTTVPTGLPTGIPTGIPTEIPTTVPTGIPTGLPTLPTGIQTELPTGLPTSSPAPRPTTATRITGTAETGRTLTATEPAWDQEGVTTTYRWQRDGVDIAGATGSTYVLTADDVGRGITVVATGTNSSGGTGTSTSEPVTPTEGDAPVATSSPRIPGKPAIGRPLTATTGTWPDPQPTFRYQWYRITKKKAAPIGGATATTYRPRSADAGRSLLFLVVAERPGYETGYAVSNRAKVPQLTSKVKATLARKTVTPAQRAVLRVGVTSGGTRVGGKVRVLDRGKVVLSSTVRAGTTSLRLPRLKPGTHRLTVTYLGDTAHRRATSAAVTLRVRRAQG